MQEDIGLTKKIILVIASEAQPSVAISTSLFDIPCSIFDIHHLSSVFCPLSPPFIIRYSLFDIRYSPSVLCLLSSVLCPLSSVLCPLSSVLCPLSSVLCLLSSVLCPLPSVSRRVAPSCASQSSTNLFGGVENHSPQNIIDIQPQTSLYYVFREAKNEIYHCSKHFTNLHNRLHYPKFYQHTTHRH